MERVRFSRVKELFQQALSLPAEEGERFLDTACAGDDELAREVRELLAHARAANGFLDGTIGGAGPAQGVLRIPGFEILESLAVGAFGTVYRALQTHPRREVALKVLRLDSLGPGQVARFRREAQILAGLDHPGIARVIASGVVEEGALALPWMALELVQGDTLDEYLSRAKLPLPRLVELFVLLCGAVEHAHAKGIVHRDLKPSNVLIDREGRPRVIDFGIARGSVDDADPAARTRTGMIVGTLSYMAPEQTRGERSITPATDVHALGLMLFEGLTGRLPLEIDDYELPDVVQAICDQEPLPLRRLRPDLPRDLETILQKALEKDPRRRYATAGALGSDLENWLTHRPVRARRATAAYHALKFARRNRALVLGATLVVLLLSLALAQTIGRLRSEQRGNARMSVLTEAISKKYFGLSERLGFGDQDRSDAEELITLIEEQLALDPTYRPLRALLAQARDDLGRLHQAGRANAEAAACYRRALELREELAREQPDDLDSRSHASRLCAMLGEIAGQRGDPVERDRWFADALARDEALVAQHPDDLELREDLGWSLERIAEAAVGKGDEATALRLRLRRLADAEELVRLQPDSWKFVRNLSHVHYFLIGRDSSSDHLSECLRLARREVELRPGVRDALSWLAQTLRVAGSRAPDRKSALGAAQEAHEIALRLMREDPGRFEHVELLRLTGLEVLVVLEDLGRTEDALALVLGVLKQVEAAVTRPGLGGFARPMGFEFAMREARLLEAAGRAQEALAAEALAFQWILDAALADPAAEKDLAYCLDALASACAASQPYEPGFLARFFDALLAASALERARWFADGLARADLSAEAREGLASVRRAHPF